MSDGSFIRRISDRFTVGRNFVARRRVRLVNGRLLLGIDCPNFIIGSVCCSNVTVQIESVICFFAGDGNVLARERVFLQRDDTGIDVVINISSFGTGRQIGDSRESCGAVCLVVVENCLAVRRERVTRCKLLSDSQFAVCNGRRDVGGNGRVELFGFVGGFSVVVSFLVGRS